MHGMAKTNEIPHLVSARQGEFMRGIYQNAYSRREFITKIALHERVGAR